MNLDLNLTKELIKDLEIAKHIEENKKDLEFFKIAHSYLEITRVLYRLLKKYKELDELQQGYNELLELIQYFQEKNPVEGEYIKEKPERRLEAKESIWNNKNILFSSLDHYITITKSLEQIKQFSTSNRNSIIAIIISLGALFLTIFFKIT